MMENTNPNLQHDLQQREAWLIEYKTCQQSISDHEGRIWQSATVFVSASIAGLALVAQRLSPTPGALFVISTTSLLSVTILLLWYRLVNRWWSLQNVLWYRMQELDLMLGMRRNLYALYMDKVQAWQLDQIGDKSGFEKMNNILSGTYTTGKARTYLRRIVVLIIGAWALLSVFELVLFGLKISI